MRFTLFLLLPLVVFCGVAVLALQQKGLLTQESLDLFLKPQPTPAVDVMPAEPIGLAVSIQEKERQVEKETARMQQLASRLEAQRSEMESERALIEEHLQLIKSKRKSTTEPEPVAPSEDLIKLSKMYEDMPPEDAAPILENLPDSTVALIVLQMRRRQAAQIMGSLSPSKAAAVSRLFVMEEPEEID